MKKKEAKTLVLILTFLMFVSVVFPPIPECASLASVLAEALVEADFETASLAAVLASSS